MRVQSFITLETEREREAGRENGVEVRERERHREGGRGSEEEKE